ncbi:putative ribosome-binding factor A, mitochondrial isoform X2 [Hyperolius riggenbachi]|uniref:putative ribosome-binding factor A, mitochondrial isoform X2 n=1 Tax=Hyperolius riggenbachi TaxID=752182 RepID=UPI0035A37F14
MAAFVAVLSRCLPVTQCRGIPLCCARVFRHGLRVSRSPDFAPLLQHSRGIHASLALCAKSYLYKFSNKSKKKYWYDSPLKIPTVSLSEDFTVCRAYWLGSGNKDTDAEIEKLLQKYAPSFRHHMISHHVIGKVPPIVFVRDKEDAKRQEVEELLSLLQSEMKNDLSVEDDGVSRTLDFEYRTEDPTVQTPSMFGIDHTELDHQISEYKKKMKDAPIETDSNELRQQQQEQLAEIRKWDMERKKLKKIKKSKFSRESPKDYLLASEIEEEESDSEQWEDRMECEEEEGVSDSTPK